MHKPKTLKSLTQAASALIVFFGCASSPQNQRLAQEQPLGPRLFNRIEALALEPRPGGSKKLQGAQHLWRVRVGDYRVVYSIDDRQRVVDIVRVRHRRDVYRLSV